MKVNYNDTATGGGSTDVIAAANVARTSFFFNALGADFILKFNHRGVDQEITVKMGSNLTVNNTHREPFDCRDAISVECASAAAYEAQAEEG
jgi:hypothetical protein